MFTTNGGLLHPAGKSLLQPADINKEHEQVRLGPRKWFTTYENVVHPAFSTFDFHDICLFTWTDYP